MLVQLKHYVQEVLTQDEWDLDLGQLQEVLGNVDGQLVQEGWGDVEAILDVVQVPGSLAQVVLAGEHGVVGAGSSLASLVQTLHHVSATSDILLHHSGRGSETSIRNDRA